MFTIIEKLLGLIHAYWPSMEPQKQIGVKAPPNSAAYFSFWPGINVKWSLTAGAHHD